MEGNYGCLKKSMMPFLRQRGMVNEDVAMLPRRKSQLSWNKVESFIKLWPYIERAGGYMVMINIRGKKRYSRRERKMSSARAWAGWLWNEHYFYPKVYNEIYSLPKVGKWNSSSFPQINNMKLHFGWHPWDGWLQANTSETGHKTKTEERNPKGSCLMLKSLLCLRFYHLCGSDSDHVSKLQFKENC